jgi:hypothetical protein
VIIETTNYPRGRRIVRADKSVHSYGYALRGRTPTVTASLEGQDGVRYSIHLTQDDIEKIVRARLQYEAEFSKVRS